MKISEILAFLILAITAAMVVASIFLGCSQAETVEVKPKNEKTIEDYQMEQMALEHEEAERLQASITEYQERQQAKAEEEFRKQSAKTNFVYYEISDEIKADGGDFPEDIQRYAFKKCEEYGVRYPVLLGLMETESSFRYRLVCADNDIGYCQIIPECHKERIKKLCITDLTDPYQNIEVCLDYLAELLEKYDGDYGMALTAYNCGPTGAYNQYFSNGIYESRYATKVLGKAERIEKELEDAAEN